MIDLKEEKDLLKAYRFTTEYMDVPHVNINNFTDYSFLSSFLQQLKDELQAPSLKVTASIFMKRYAFLAVIQLATMSYFHKAFSLNGNIYLQEYKKDQLWLPNFYFDHISIHKTKNNRKTWRDEVIIKLFKEHLNPIMNDLYKKTKISKKILWENVFIYISWFYESSLEDEMKKSFYDQLKEDYLYIVYEAEGNLFGDYKENPFKKFYEHRINGFGIRKTCCYSYLLKSKGGRCRTCPLICNNDEYKR